MTHDRMHGHLVHSLEMLGSAAFRVRLRSAEEGARWAAQLRASGRVLEAWHTESHLAFIPKEGEDPRALLELGAAEASARETREHALEAVLDGPDRDEVARAAQLSRGKLDQLLYDTPLTVSFVGFSPGFAYLRGLPPSLHLPRRDVPRPRIPKGALALAGGFAGIYPSATAGGWNLVGSVQKSLLDDGGPLLSAGDVVRLVPPSLDRTLRDPERRELEDSDAAIVLEEVRGLSFIEDGGREGRLHQGVPPSGALLPAWLARANLAVGNEPGAAGIERYGALRVRARVNTVLATEDGRPHRLRAGESMDLDWHGAARAGYVAFAGGIDVPLVLGGRGTHVRAGLGGLGGRALRKGDALRLHPPSAALPSSAMDPLDTSSRGAEAPLIGVHAGPDLGHFLEGSIARLTATAWRISHMSDRMGSRLEGGRIEHRKNGPPAESAPLVLGAIEVPPSGEPIVLGPEHPSTGGYPVIGVVRAADLPDFLRRPLGSTVRFTLASR